MEIFTVILALNVNDLLLESYTLEYLTEDPRKAEGRELNGVSANFNFRRGVGNRCTHAVGDEFSGYVAGIEWRCVKDGR